MNLYAILNVEPTASQNDIKKAYRRLAQVNHPDKNHGNKEAKAKMQDIQRAYDILGDPERRKRYDETGATQDGPTTFTIAREQLAMLFVQMADNKDADSFDFKKGARDTINAMITDMKGKITLLQRSLRNIEKARKRLKRKTEGEPFLIQVLDAHMRQTKEKIAHHENNIEVAGIMLKMLDDYEYEVEAETQRPQTFEYIEEMIAKQRPTFFDPFNRR